MTRPAAGQRRHRFHLHFTSTSATSIHLRHLHLRLHHLHLTASATSAQCNTMDEEEDEPLADDSPFVLCPSTFEPNKLGRFRIIILTEHPLAQVTPARPSPPPRRRHRPAALADPVLRPPLHPPRDVPFKAAPKVFEHGRAP